MKWARITTNEWVSEDFRIVKFFEHDRGNTIPRYAVQYRGGRILDWKDPVDLAEARGQAEQYAQYLQVRQRREENSERLD